MAIENAVLEQKVSEWLKWDENEKTQSEIFHLRDNNKMEELGKLFKARLEFGTAGLRGKMGPGPSQMNDLVIIQTGQGLCSYLEDTFKESVKRGIVIGYDGRHNSKRFAALTAAIFLKRDIPVYLFSKVCPTPFIPFTVVKYACVAGIMVTASHNPKEDNGYKVYWDNGTQIISPHDKNIQQGILNHLSPWKDSWNVDILEASKILTDPLSDVMQDYFEHLKMSILSLDVNANCSLKMTYTAMHGVGYPYMVEGFRIANLKPFIVVEEQKDPDPEFSTVKFPNPEEGKSSLDLSIQTADRHGSSLILANDPDADRLAAAEKMNGRWHVYSGNELGALLGWWSLYCYRQKHGQADLKDVYMLASTVSSKFLRSMGAVEGYNFTETLTGFKWMGNKSVDLMSEGKTVLFAYEEAIGFMYGTTVLDKDGISAGVKVAELAAYLQTQGKTLADKLQELYSEYGYHISSNSYYLCYDKDVIQRLFDRLRNFSGAANTYPMSLMDGKYKVTSIRDLTTGFDSSRSDNKAILPVSKSSQMITFTFSNGLVATLRTSGTEPKIKYYTELCASPKKRNLDVLKATLQEMVLAIVQEYLQPEVNGLIERSP